MGRVGEEVRASEPQLVDVMTTLVSRRAKVRLSRVNLTRPVQLAG